MLTDTKYRTAKAQDKPYKLTDGKGLYLERGATASSSPAKGRSRRVARERVALKTVAKKNGPSVAAEAGTRLNEMGYPADWIERQLAHAEPNTVRRTYNHADYLADRSKMMQHWADALDA